MLLQQCDTSKDARANQGLDRRPPLTVTMGAALPPVIYPKLCMATRHRAIVAASRRSSCLNDAKQSPLACTCVHRLRSSSIESHVRFDCIKDAAEAGNPTVLGERPQRA